MIGKSVFLVALIMHICAYKEYYISILSSFVVTYTLKKLIKCLDSDIADCFAVGGYAEVAMCIMVLLVAVKNNGKKTLPEGQEREILGGWLGAGWNKLKDKFIKH